MVKRGHEEGEALIHPFRAIRKRLGGGLGNLGEGRTTIETLPDKAPEIIETDLGVGHEPSQVVEDGAETPGLRFGSLDHDHPVPIGLPGPEPMGNAVQHSVVDEIGHVRERWSGSHTRRTNSSG